MTRTLAALVAPAIFIASLGGGATAQTAAPATTTRGGGLGGLLGGALPGLGSIGSVGAGNAAGLLGYCLQNNLLGAGARATSATPAQTATTTGAQGVLQRLLGRKDVQASPGLAAGQVGQVQTGNGRALSLDGLQGQVKTQACNLVLNRAKAFL